MAAIQVTNQGSNLERLKCILKKHKVFLFYLEIKKK